MFGTIIAMLPFKRKYSSMDGVLENEIEHELIRLFNNEENLYNRGILKATHSAFVSMTISECKWETIWLMFATMEEHFE